ncbi:MAG: YitT family protein [Erysipelotrichaceae bacterium]
MEQTLSYHGNNGKKQKYRDLITIICVVIASAIMAININTFVSAGGLYPGGLTGLTVLIQRVFDSYFGITLPYTLVNLSLNAIPAYIGYRTVGKKFTMFSVLMILLTGIFVDVLPISSITYDILLIAVFGGIINGVALGISLRGGASSGGTDFIAIALSKKLNMPTWNYIMGYNVVMLLAAGYLFGWEKALYSIIFQFCSTQILNTIHLKYKKMTLFIITNKGDEVAHQLLVFTHHGVTRFEGIGTYSNKPRTLLYTVIATNEVKKVMNVVRMIDGHAFINVAKTEQVDGRFYQPPIE